MNDNTNKKLSENESRIAGIGALRQIRKLVDNFENQNRKNKQKAIATRITPVKWHNWSTSRGYVRPR